MPIIITSQVPLAPGAVSGPALPPAPPDFNPATGFDWTGLSGINQSNPPPWHAPDAAFDGPVPVVPPPAFNPALGFAFAEDAGLYVPRVEWGNGQEWNSPGLQPLLVPTVPLSIDSTGATDVSAALIAHLQTYPNGTLLRPTWIVFQPFGVYRIDSAIKLPGGVLSNIHIAMNGATIKYVSNVGQNENFSVWYFQAPSGGSVNVTLQGPGTLIGCNTNPGHFLGGSEGQHGVLMDGGSGFEVYGLTIKTCWGDGFYTGTGATQIRVHHNTVLDTGRNGYSSISGNHVEMDHNEFTTMGYMPFDVEPNNAGENSDNINFHHNTGDTWTNAFFAANGGNTSTNIHDITVDSNHWRNAGLLSVVTIVSSPRRNHITITNNISDISVAGSVFRMSHVDQLVIQHNTQSLSSGSLLSILDCPGAVTTPNP